MTTEAATPIKRRIPRKRVRGRTPESYRKEIDELTKGEYSVIENFIDTTAPILHRHNSCGYKWSTRPSKFIHCGRRCPKCAGKIMQTSAEYAQKISVLTLGEYEVIGSYAGSSVPILHRHNGCGHEWSPIPNSFIQGSRCPECALIKKTPESYRVEVDVSTGGDFSVIGDYLGGFDKILHKHNVCGYKWQVRPSDFLFRKKCPKCSKKIRRSHQEYVDDVDKMFGEEFVIIDQYRGSKVPITHRHEKCGFVWRVSPYDFAYSKSPSSCPRCAGVASRTPYQYKNEIHALTRGEYSVLGDYVNIETPIAHLHNKCQFIWNTRPHSFLGGTRCPKCNESRGERRVSKALDNLNLKYVKQYRIKECKVELPLPFDFAIQLPSNRVLLIEYDGEQHFRSVESWGGERALTRRQHYDRIKTEYCRANGIPLIRIPFTQFDEIETILERELTQLGVIGNRQSMREQMGGDTDAKTLARRRRSARTVVESAQLANRPIV